MWGEVFFDPVEGEGESEKEDDELGERLEEVEGTGVEPGEEPEGEEGEGEGDLVSP